ncbi:MAG: phosphotransferase [Candidatus Didemnitutus sp.]|nr:phosphotransferase [Candidatus Didemnitutus sp.]
MRVSLLLNREPFGEILAETLTSYWTARMGTPHTVVWGNAHQGQRWWGNTYLNFYAAAGTAPAMFDVLRCEYTTSRIWWKRPLQKCYVTAATRFPSLRWLANSAFAVTPAVPDAERTLVLGGNHRLRLLQPMAGRSVVVLKSRFGREHLDGEIALREALQPACAPQLLATHQAQGWFEEAYVVGTPINRLPAAEETRWKAAAVRAVWAQVVAPSLETVDAAVWSEQLLVRFKALVQRCHAPGGAEILALAEALAVAVVERTGAAGLPMAWTHGDLQEANIVTADGAFWVIDWESAAKRFAAYDFFQLASGGRWTGPGWPERVARVVAGNAEPTLANWLKEMPALTSDATTRRTWGLAYLLEELWYRASENAEPAFFQPGADWVAIHREVQAAREAMLAP